MIRLAEKKDIPNLMNLSLEAFGKGFHDEMYFQKKDGECIVYTNDQLEIVGYCLSINTSKGIKLSSIAISENQRGKGIGSMLIEDLLLEHSQKYIYTYAWRRNGDVPLAPILKRLGFHEKEEIAKYWYRDSIEKAYTCPECGSPCYCSAVIYEK